MSGIVIILSNISLHSDVCIDISNAVRFDSINRLDIRITDPGGNFTWSNNDWYAWGNNRVPANHGFGGITGKLVLRATDDVHIDEIIPCSAWDLPTDNKYCWHYLNSQWLLAEDNLSKSDSYQEKDKVAMIERIQSSIYTSSSEMA